MTLRPIRRRDGLEVSLRIEVADFGVHRAARRQIGRGAHSQTGVVVVGDVLILGLQRCLLFDQSAARVEDVSDFALKNAKPHPIKCDLHSLTNCGCPCGFRVKLAQETACPVRCGRRKIEKGIPPASTFSCFRLVERLPT